MSHPTSSHAPMDVDGEGGKQRYDSAANDNRQPQAGTEMREVSGAKPLLQEAQEGRDDHGQGQPTLHVRQMPGDEHVVPTRPIRPHPPNLRSAREELGGNHGRAREEEPALNTPLPPGDLDSDGQSEPDDFEKIDSPKTEPGASDGKTQQVGKLQKDRTSEGVGPNRNRPLASSNRRPAGPERPPADSRAWTGGWGANGFFWSREPPRMTNMEIDELIHHNRQLLEHQRWSQQHADKLSSMVTRLETELKQVREDLGASRAFVASETSVDAKDLLQKLRDINEAVDDFAFNMLQHPMLEEELESPLTTTMCRSSFALIEGDLSRLCVNFANFALSNRMTIGQYIQPVAQMLFLHFLLTVVFTPFIPGLAAKESKPIEKLFNQISETEPQDRSARWRAITYSRGFPGRDDQVIARDCSHAFLRTLHAILFSCIQKVQKESSGPDDSRWMESLEVTVQTIIQDAIKWQDRAKTSHLSYEYIPSFTINSSFDPRRMFIEDDGGGRAEGQPRVDEDHVLLCVGFGLLAVKTVLAPDSKALRKEGKQLIKTKVFCGKLIRAEGS